jgi:hypothetical protein
MDIEKKHDHNNVDKKRRNLTTTTWKKKRRNVTTTTWIKREERYT